MARARAMLISVGLLLAAGGVWINYSRGATPPPAKPAAVRPIAVSTATVERRDLPIRVRSVGWVEPVATVAVGARIDSQIVEQFVKDGQMVAAGDLLFKLDDRQLKARVAQDEAALVRVQATQVRAQLDLKRAQDLMARSVGSVQARDQAVADAKAADADVQAAEATLEADRLQLSFAEIRAPITGRAGAVAVTPGNLVSANSVQTPLVTITQMAPVRVRFTLPERELPALRAELAAGHPPETKVFNKGDPQPLSTGQLTFLDSTVDQQSGTVTVKAMVANDHQVLWPGQYVAVELDLGVHKDAVVVPTVALQSSQKGPFVFVVKPDQTIDVRQVQVVGADGDHSAVTGGLQSGERVVIDGQLRLAQGVKVDDRTTAKTASVGSAG